jgi:hypothetical protein
MTRRPSRPRLGFSRRTFLRGAGGLVVGLPLLELTSGKAWAQSATVEKRLVSIFSHGGEIQCRNRTGTKSHGQYGETYTRIDDWAPTVEQEALTTDILGRTHSGVFTQAQLDKMLLLRGVDNMAVIGPAPYNGDHNYANVTALTAADCNSYDDKDNVSSLGASIEQVIADRLGTVPLRLEIPGHNYGTPYFQAPLQRASGNSDVRGVFDALFSDIVANPDGPDPAVLRLRRMKKSVLDGVFEGLTRFRTKIGRSDKDILDAHLESIRDLELRIEDFENTLTCSAPNVDAIGDEDPDQRQDLAAPLMIDILANAIACGRAQVASYEIGDLITGWLGDPWESAFGIGHSLHHGANDVGPGGIDEARADIWRDEMNQNRQWRLGLMARLMDRLASMPEGDVTALDNSLIFYTSEFSAGAYHSSADIPLLLAGSAGGYFRTGRHLNFNTADPSGVDYATTASTHNVFTSMLHAFGQSDAHFGSAHAYVQGPLPDLT